MIIFNSVEPPSESGVYLVDRGMQGIWFRGYNADTKTWGFCEDNPDAAEIFKVSPLGMFPWASFVRKQSEVVASNGESLIVATAEPLKRASKKSVDTSKMVDGDIFFREDREKYVAIWGGKQVAARDTMEACIKFLSKKYNFTYQGK